MLQAGNTVTVTVRNPRYESRHLYANNYNGPKFEEYTGTVVYDKWHGDELVGLTTNQPGFPLRVLSKKNIVKVEGADFVHTPVVSETKTIFVEGTKGNSYVVTIHNGKKSCTCAGFSFRKTCKHLDLLI
jgi:hypothetical protein